MAHINLLPWRERLREERKREFLSIMAGIVVIAGGLLFLVDRYFTGEINLQVIVRLFDELVRTLPEGVFYTTLERTDDTIAINGISESYSRITELLRRLDESQWLSEPDISEISAADSVETAMSAAFVFTLTVNLELPNQADEEV